MDKSSKQNITDPLNCQQHNGKGDFFRPVVQRKLVINAEGDAYEREADAIADKVMQSAAQPRDTFFKPVSAPVLQKSSGMIQRVSGNESPRYEDAERREEETDVQAKRPGDTIVQRLSARESSGGRDLIASNVAPWRGTEPTGDDYNVYTDAGTAVPAWVAIQYDQEAHRYWCHGHSLGTYRQWLYSVYSGPPLERTLADEYNNIAEASVSSSDIAVWQPSFGHSCKIENVVRTGGAIDAGRTIVSTKNGPNPLTTTSLSSVMSTYAGLRSTVNYYRRK